MIKKHLHYFLPILLAAALFALPKAQAGWTAPLCLPTDGDMCNPAPSVNVGPVAQEKEGDFTFAGLGTFLDGIGVVGSSFGLTDAELNYKFILSPENLNPAAGKVLTALDEEGNASWEMPSGGSGSLDYGQLYSVDGNNGAKCEDYEGGSQIVENAGIYLCFTGATPK